MNLKNKYSILYAEDNKEVQEEVLEYLNKYFMEVYVANDGREALELYAKESVDALLLDIDMPFVDGLTVAKEVRSTNKKIPMVMLTAFTDTDKLLFATELHLCKYVVKPIVPLEFKATIKKLLEDIDALQTNRITLAEGYSWHEERKELYVKGECSVLSQKEQALLELLISKRNQCTTFTDIMAKLWEDDFEQEVSVESVKLQVCFLRKKLPKNIIQNVYAKGYILK